MKTDVTQEQIQSYQTNGFLIIEDFLTPDELTIWRDAVDDAVTGRGKTKLAGHEADERWQAGDSYYDSVFIQRINLWQDSDAVRKLMLNPELGKMIATLAGVDGIRIWHDQALIKQPWANPTGWHLDNPYWSFHSSNAISIWVALDDATLQNGCLYYLPGTHKSATYDNVGIGQNMGDIFRVYPQWSKIEAVPAVMKAGSCGLHNGLIAHGAGANMTPGWRRAMTCAYMPDGATYNGKRNVLPDRIVERLQIGDPIEDDSQNPLIYHPTKPLVSALG
ncbi:MAG: phytanoyl-CoA dioxygenase family protein [Caldilineaceae bacterium]